MNPIGVIFRKEAFDHVRDRRSLMSALVFPLIGPLLIASLFTLMASWESSDKPLEISVVGRARAPNLIAFLQRHGAKLTDAPDDYEAKIRDGDLGVVVVVPEEFGKDFQAGHAASVEVVQDSSNNRTRRPVARTESLLRAYAHEIGALRLLARGVSPELAGAVSVDEVDVATKQQQGAMLLNMLPVFLLMGAFIAGMHLAIDAMAGERERGSLEPLLVNPVSARQVVLGKWLATVAAALVGVMVMLGAFGLAIPHIPLEELGMHVRFGAREMAMMLGMVAPLLLFTSALQLLVATFARSFKEAQTYVSFVMLAPMAPEMFLSLSPVKPHLWMHAIPTIGQQLLMTDVMRGDAVTMPAVLIACAGAVIAALLCLFATARLLVQERIVFGR